MPQTVIDATTLRTTLRTHSGALVSPLAPRIEDLSIADIAHALSQICRFGGHTSRHYSVAQHSVYVSLRLPGVWAKWGLLHDASEAYLGDIPRPLKQTPLFEGYRRAEATLQALIYAAFGLEGVVPPAVHEADDLVLGAEIRDLMPSRLDDPWVVHSAAVGPIEPVTPRHAELLFLGRFRELWG